MINDQKTSGFRNPIIERIREGQSSSQNEADVYRLSNEEIVFRFSNLYNPELFGDCFKDLKEHYKNFYIHEEHIPLFCQVIQALPQYSNNDENKINEVIAFLIYIAENDRKFIKKIVEQKIYLLFFPLIRTSKGLDFFAWLLFENSAPLYIEGEIKKELEKELEKDYTKDNIREILQKLRSLSGHLDEKNAFLEELIIMQGKYNIVAHFLIENNISDILLEMIKTDKKEMVLDVLYELGKCTFTFQSMSQLLNELYPIIMNDPELKTRSRAIDALAKFASTSMAGLYFSIKNQILIELLTNPPLDSGIILKSLLFYAEQTARISRFMDQSDLILVVSYIYNIILNASVIGSSSLLEGSLKVISKVAKTSSEFTNFCIEKGIINTLIQMIDSFIPFICQKYVFLSLCNFFYMSDLNGALYMWNSNFLEILSLYIQAMFSDDDRTIEKILNTLQTIITFSQKYPQQCGEWLDALFSSEEIIKALSDIACEPGCTGEYPEDSVEVFAYSILLDEPRY